MIDRATDYAERVQSGAIVAGPHVRDAAARHLRDLKDGPARGLLWDPAAAHKACEYFRLVLRFPDGPRAGQPFRLEDWQAFVVGSCFGWKYADTGMRRYRTCYIETAKGSGKSPCGAGMGLILLASDGMQGAECYVAAVTRDQAKIAFKDAVRMVDSSPALSSRLVKSGNRDVFNLLHSASGSFFRPLSSEGRALDGKRVHFALLDEVHEHPTSVVVDKIHAGVKGSPQPLIAEITNSGYDRNSVCWHHHKYSIDVAAGTVEDDQWFSYVCALDEGDDPLLDADGPDGYPLCWLKANPSLGVTIQPDYLRKQVREALGMPSKESIVRRLNFCQWVDAADPWINGDLWRSCEAEFDLSEHDGQPCFAALDLSGARDLTACALLFPHGDGLLDAAVWYWTPADTLAERSRTDSVPYDAWVRAGHLEATPGKVVDYRFVAQQLADFATRFDLRAVAFDPWRIAYLQQELDALGVGLPLVAHGQGYMRAQDSGLWMPRSVELLEKAVFDGRLRVLRNPVLSWNSASAVLAADPKNNRIFDKRKSTGKIDGLVALAMSIGASDTEDAGFDLSDFFKDATV